MVARHQLTSIFTSLKQNIFIAHIYASKFWEDTLKSLVFLNFSEAHNPRPVHDQQQKLSFIWLFTFTFNVCKLITCRNRMLNSPEILEIPCNRTEIVRHNF